MPRSKAQFDPVGPRPGAATTPWWSPWIRPTALRLPHGPSRSARRPQSHKSFGAARFVPGPEKRPKGCARPRRYRKELPGRGGPSTRRAATCSAALPRPQRKPAVRRMNCTASHSTSWWRYSHESLPTFHRDLRDVPAYIRRVAAPPRPELKSPTGRRGRGPDARPVSPPPERDKPSRRATHGPGTNRSCRSVPAGTTRARRRPRLLKRHHVEKVPVSSICDDSKLQVREHRPPELDLHAALLVAYMPRECYFSRIPSASRHLRMNSRKVIPSSSARLRVCSIFSVGRSATSRFL